jgi:hypothetical protein
VGGKETILSLLFYSFFGLIGLLLILFTWSVRNPTPPSSPSSYPDECGRRHMTYLPQIRQAFAETDFDFLSKKASGEVQRRVRRERRGVALAYLAALREDFQSLLRMARVIAALAPELAAVHEFERLRLTTRFVWQYQMIRWRVLAGMAPVPQLNGLSDIVSSLSVRMETVMKELGERAAVAAELASSMNRRRLDVV